MPKHDWNSLDNYIQVHEKVLRFFSTYMRVPKVYTFTWVNAARTHLDLECNGIEFTTGKGSLVGISIEKSAMVDRGNPNRILARTVEYKYHAFDLQTGRGILRYCSPDQDATHHHSYHHRHEFPVGANSQSGVISRMREDTWPHVGEFLTEIQTRF